MASLIENLNQGDRFARGIGVQLTEILLGYARAEVTVEEHHLNGAGVCQGGVLFTLSDLAFAAVANSRGILTLGISNTITMLKSAQLGDRLTAECHEVHNHHRLPYCDMRITNQDGDLIATMTGLAYRMKKDFPFDTLMAH